MGGGKVSAVSSKPQPADSPLDFEEAVAQIEQIIERIESGEVGLEASITEYERGVGLLKRCRAVLSKAEQRVEELTAKMQADAGTAEKKGPDARGEPSETPF